MPQKSHKLNTKAVLQAYWRHTLNYKWMFVVAVTGMVLQQVAYVISPLFLREFFNLLTAVPIPPSAIVTAPLIFFAALQLGAWGAGRIEMGLGLYVISQIARDLTDEAYGYLMRHSYGFFTSSFAGALVQRVRRYKDSYERLYYSIQTNVGPAVLYIIGITIVLLTRNLVMGLVLFGWAVFFVALQWLMIRWQQPFRLKRAQEDSNLTAVLADSISNQNTVVLFSGNRQEEILTHAAAEKFRVALWRTWQGDLLMYGVQGILGIAINVGLMWLAYIYYQQGLLTIGDLLLVQVYVFGLFNHVWGLGREIRIIYSVLADASEMAEILQTPHEITDKKNAKKLKVKSGEVWFDDVSFEFNKDASILKHFNLTIAGGEKVALVGPSGAGKSTVTKLLLRLYDVQKGEVKIDGQDIAKVTQDSLREQIAFVPQEPILFHRTLMENIRYGRRDATEDEVIEAAKKAHCHEFISKLPQGYDTFVGERGIKLSGGERQRVAIARAMLKDAPILVLDEATSSLDSESEALIQQALEVLMQGKTVMVIAHRLSTIMKMDRIIVMSAEGGSASGGEGGKIVATGTHLELVNQAGLYRKLWSIQVGGFIGSPNEVNINRLGGAENNEEEVDELDGLAEVPEKE